MRLDAVERRATPGPWELQKIDCPSWLDRNNYELTAASPHIEGKLQQIAEFRGPWKSINYQANAALVAHWHRMGPVLLEALKLMCATIEEGDDAAIRFALESIKAAKKVEGI